jgi:signal transduction histidine kinase
LRRRLIRSTLLAVVLSVLILGVPIFALAAWHLERVDRPLRASTVSWPILLLAVLVLSVLAVVAGVLVATNQSRRLAEPMTQLAEMAEKLGAGQSRTPAMRSGVEEIDRVSQVLERRAKELAASLASEREFAADASHQLRTPLTALLMRIEEIGATDDLEVVREEANIAIAQVERLTGVVDDLLTRTRRGREDESTAVSLDSVIAALQREWQPAFEQARRCVRVGGARGLQVQANRSSLSQVLSTLLENSLVHGKGTVDVHARRAGPSVVVEVGDQGPGVPAALAPHIFERSVSSGKSTGLGLALARDLAEADGGRLELIQAQPVIFAFFVSEAPGT